MAEMGSTLSVFTPSADMPLKSSLTNGTIRAISPVDKFAKNACLQELTKKPLSPRSIDLIFKEFAEAFPEGPQLKPADFLNLGMPSFDPADAPSRFIAPVHHTSNQGHWTLVSVACETSFTKSIVRAQHYDSIPNRARAELVKDSIKRWAERYHGDNNTLEFENNIPGPENKDSKMSGVYIVMALRAFIQSGHTNGLSEWDETPGKYIRGILEGKKKPSLPVQESLLPPSRNDEVGQRSSPKVPSTPRKNPALSLEYREDSLAARARTPSVTTRKLAGDLAGKMTPPKTDQPLRLNSKRRRTESGSPLKYEQVIYLAQSYPSLTSLKEESEERVSDLETKQKMLREKNEASARIQQQFEEYEEDHNNASRECENLKEQIAKHEQAVNDYLAMIPLVPEGVFLTAEDMMNIMVTKFEESAAPTRKELQGKQELKRKASDLLESMDQKRIALEADVCKAVEEQSLAEEEAKKAIRLHDEAEAAEEYRKKMELVKENLDSSDWLKKWHDRRGGA